MSVILTVFIVKIQILKKAKVTFICEKESKKRRARCLKITEKVSFNIASEASYVYILSVDKS